MVFGEGGVMNRFHKAWLALTGRLEPEVVERFANVEPVTIYKVDYEYWAIDRMFRDGMQNVSKCHYPSCEAAFEATQGKSYFHVEQVAALRVGNDYFPKDSRLKVWKPKRPKGKRA